MKTRSPLLVLAAVWKLIEYDLVHWCFGFRGVLRLLARTPLTAACGGPRQEKAIESAMRWAACFYFKPIRCLQAAITTARLLRGQGVEAEVKFGYRLTPFFGHAWVEVGGRVVSGGAGYRKAVALIAPAPRQ